MSYRSDTHGSYDHTLLSSVPGPTRAEKQEGYDVDLLDGSRDRRAPTPPTNGVPSEPNGATALDYSPGAVSYARKEESAAATNEYEAVEKRVPWYRTRKGIIAIAVVLLVIIIAAAVGGGVGGSHHSSHSSAKSANITQQPSNNSTGVPSSNATQGTGPASNSSSSSSAPPSLGVSSLVPSTSPEANNRIRRGVV
ncbi:hypothetical protein EI94DRAFT_1799014 [Lactarius quietus]|nr:hypothetical protein EI94DRAFT_1799014 [Lactarius quietus]